jgi:hypothetical protein
MTEAGSAMRSAFMHLSDHALALCAITYVVVFRRSFFPEAQKLGKELLKELGVK